MKANPRVALYCRVSTETQDLDAQTKRLESWAAALNPASVTTFAERVSGASANRPALRRLLDGAGRRAFDFVAVENLDRLSRSLHELVLILDALNTAGVGFVSINDPLIDTRTAAGKLQFHIVAAFAEFERERIGERVKAGLQSARADGIRLGRPSLAPETVQRIGELCTLKVSIRKIALELGVSTATVAKYRPLKLEL